MTDKSLIQLNTRHQALVKNLKAALLIGQEGFLRAGAILAKIKDDETFKAEDAHHEWSWNDFISRADLPFPGRTPQSRRRTADALIRIFKTFKQKFGYQTDVLAPIGWTKLDLLASIVENEGDKEIVDEWLDRARELSASSLALEIKGKDEEIGDKLSCQHPNAYQMWFCPECGARSKEDLRKKHGRH